MFSILKLSVLLVLYSANNWSADAAPSPGRGSISPGGAVNRIHRGSTARKKDYRYNVWVRKGRAFQCGASLIAADWVLTAASCFEDSVLENYEMMVGDYNRKKKRDGEVAHTIDRVVVYPSFDRVTLKHNIALVHLSSPADTELSNIELVSGLSNTQVDATTNSRNCILCGWGQKYNGALNKKMQFLSINIENNTECSAGNDDSYLCYSSSPGSACQGDQGSPIMCYDRGVWVQVGVNSDGTCIPGSHMGVQVSSVYPWIQGTIDVIAACGHPPNVTNGIFRLFGGNVGFDKAILDCDSGFKPSSDAASDIIITCNSNGQWSSTDVTCIADTQDCDDPPEIENGKFVPTADGSAALLECDDTFSPFPDSASGLIIVCQSDGQWSSTDTTCVSDSSSCGDPPEIDNGKFVPTADGSAAILVCKDNFSPSSDSGSIIVCQTDGQWSSTDTTCEPDSSSCGDPPDIENGQFWPAVDGSAAVLECKDNFSPSSDSASGLIIVCQTDGQWSSTDTTCEPDSSSCGDPPDIENGQFWPAVDGSAAVLECKDNFSPSSDSASGLIIVCQTDGQWSSTDTTCEPDSSSCGHPPRIDNGKFVPTADGSAAILVCKDNFSPSSDSGWIIVCQTDGQWSSTDTTCEPDSSSCGHPPGIENGKFVPTADGSAALLKCNDNFSPSSDSGLIIVCQTDGQWSSTDTTCEPDSSSCGHPPGIENGKFVPTADGSAALLKCNDNFSPSSDSGLIIVCQTDGQWSSTDTTCEPDSSSCGHPPGIENGKFVPTADGSAAWLKCYDNFSPSSDSGLIIVCQTDGQWSSTDTTCEPDSSSCGHPPGIENGKFVPTADGSAALLKCNDNFSPSSDSGLIIVCQTDGQWSSTDTTCEPDSSSCGHPPGIENGKFVPTADDSAALLKCNDNFSPSSDSGLIIVCQTDGQWSSTDTTCEPIPVECGNPPRVSKGHYISNGNDIVGDTATLQCKSKHCLHPDDISAATIVCQDNGHWSQGGAICTKCSDESDDSDDDDDDGFDD